MAQTQQLSVHDKAVAFIDGILDEIESSLPETVAVDRFRAAAVNLAVHSPTVYSCTADSLRSSLLKCATDGLIPDGRLAAIVPYRAKGNDGKYYMVAQYIPMYQGLISRARELGEMFSVTCNNVHQNDIFSIDEADPSITTHKRPPLNQDRGGIVGAYVIFRDKDGRIIHREIMDAKELAKVQAVSRAKEGPWKQWPDQMSKKSVIRRGSKYIPMSNALRTIVERDDELVDPNANGSDSGALPDYNPLTGKTIEHQPKTASPEVSVTQPRRDANETGEEPPAAAEELPSDVGGGGAPPPEQGSLPIADYPPKKPIKAGNLPPTQSTGGSAANSTGATTPTTDGTTTPTKPAKKENPGLILVSYSNELMDAKFPGDLQTRSTAFWEELRREFPDEGTKMGKVATAIYAAHLARVSGHGSPADVDALMKTVTAETAW